MSDITMNNAGALTLGKTRRRVTLRRPKSSAKPNSLWIASGLLIACAAATPLVALTPFGSTWTYDWWLGAAAIACLITGLSLVGLVLFGHAVLDEHEMRPIGVGLTAVVASSVVVTIFATELTSSAQHSEWLMAGRVGPAVVGMVVIIAATTQAVSRLGSIVQLVLALVVGSTLLAVPFAMLQPPGAAIGFGLATLALTAAGVEITRHRQSRWVDHGWIALALCGVAGAEALIALGHSGVVYLVGASVVTAIGFVCAHTAIRSSLLRRLRSDLSATTALLETQCQLQEQHRSQERSLAQLAHDTRSTAVALEAAVEIILNTPNAPVEVIALSSALGDEVGRMRRTVADIVDKEMTVVTHPVWDSIESVVRCRSAQVSDLRIDVTFGVRAYSDPDTLAAIVDALMANAVEHGGAGLVSVAVTSSGNTAIISVDDDGPGVADVCREIVLERGVTSKRDDHQGLGLFGAAERARSVGGSIEVKASAYGGARFEVHVPMLPVESLVPMARARSGR